MITDNETLNGRIEALEAQLAAERANADRLAAALGLLLPEVCPRCGGDCGSANPPVYACPMDGHNALAAHTEHGGGKANDPHARSSPWVLPRLRG